MDASGGTLPVTFLMIVGMGGVQSRRGVDVALRAFHKAMQEGGKEKQKKQEKDKDKIKRKRKKKKRKRQKERRTKEEEGRRKENRKGKKG